MSHYFTGQERKSIKSTLSIDDSRRKRAEGLNALRKQKREEMLSKRRKQTYAETDPETAEKIEQIPMLVDQLRNGDDNAKLEATMAFRRLLSQERSPPIDAVVQHHDVIPMLVRFLDIDHNLLQFEAAWALTNIASGTSDHTNLVIRAGAVGKFLLLLNSQYDNVREQAAWALGNIAGDSIECRDLILSQGAMLPLLNIIQQKPKVSILRNVTWTVSNLCRGKPLPDFDLVKDAIPVIVNLIFNSDIEVLTDACWALSYLSDGPNERIEEVVRHNCCRRLVELLNFHNPDVQIPALRTIGNIVTGTDDQTQTMINSGCLESLRPLLSHQRKSIRKEACWTISNITAGNTNQIKSVIDAGLIPPLIDVLSQSDWDVKKEAAWAISNATSGGSEDQIRHIVEQGCLKPLCDLLGSKDGKVIEVALEAIENILRTGQRIAQREGVDNRYADFVDECGGIEKLEQLQLHKSEEIYAKVYNIMDQFFEMDEEEPTHLNDQPQYQRPQGGFNF